MSYARNKRKKMRARMKRFGLSQQEAYTITSWSRSLQQVPLKKG